MTRETISTTLLSLFTGSVILSSVQAAQAEPATYCRPIASNHTVKSNVYADGYRVGEQSARNGEAAQPRTIGAEFARGFEDGYFNRPYTGQVVVVSNKRSISQDCVEGEQYTSAPPVISNYPYPVIDFSFGFGRFYPRWGHYGRW